MSRLPLLRRLPRPAAIALAVAGLTYLASLAVLAREPDLSLVEPLFLLVVLGVAYPLLAWALAPRRRRCEARLAAAVPGHLRTGGAGLGLSALQAALPDEPTQSLASC